MNNSTLPVRSFGRRGETVTAIGLGGAVLTKSSYDDGLQAVRRAQELGVTYFDTSPGYCGNLSQPVFGEAVDRLHGHFMATKLGYLPEPSDFRSVDALKRQVEDNLRLLRRESVDLLQVHEANWECWWADGVAAKGKRIEASRRYDFQGAPVMEVLDWAKEQGLCRYTAVTGNVAPEIARVLDAVPVDAVLIAYSYDLIIRDAEREVIPIAKRKGIPVILGAVFYAGRLTAVHREWLDTPPEWMDADTRERYAELYAVQEESGIPLARLAVRFALAQPDASVVLIGAKNGYEVEESVQAALEGPLPDSFYSRIRALGRP